MLHTAMPLKLVDPTDTCYKQISQVTCYLHFTQPDSLSRIEQCGANIVTCSIIYQEALSDLLIVNIVGLFEA